MVLFNEENTLFSLLAYKKSLERELLKEDLTSVEEFKIKRELKSLQKELDKQ